MDAVVDERAMDVAAADAGFAAAVANVEAAAAAVHAGEVEAQMDFTASMDVNMDVGGATDDTAAHFAIAASRWVGGTPACSRTEQQHQRGRWHEHKHVCYGRRRRIRR